MKKYLIIVLLVILCMADPACAWWAVGATGGGVSATAPSVCTGKLICNNFETASYGSESAAWSEYTPSGCTVDEYYGTGPLDGSRSWYTTYSGGDDCWGKVTFTAGSPRYIFMLYQVGTLPSGNITPFYFFDASDNVVARWGLRSTGYSNACHGPAYDDCSADDSIDKSSSKLYVWITYSTTSLEIWVGTTGAFSSATKTVSLTGLTARGNLNKIQLGSSSGVIYRIDQMIVSSSSIGDVTF